MSMNEIESDDLQCYTLAEACEKLQLSTTTAVRLSLKRMPADTYIIKKSMMILLAKLIYSFHIKMGSQIGTLWKNL